MGRDKPLEATGDTPLISHDLPVHFCSLQAGGHSSGFEQARSVMQFFGEFREIRRKRANGNSANRLPIGQMFSTSSANSRRQALRGENSSPAAFTLQKNSTHDALSLDRNRKGIFAPRHRAIERVTLKRLSPSLSNQPNQIRSPHSLRSRRASIVVNLLLDHRAIDIIRTESQRD